MKKEYIRLLVISLLVVLLYGNTLTLNYTLDDRLVIFQNDYTLKGFAGMKEVITEDGFSGYFGKDRKLVAGGRYRPLAQLTFILEYELFGGNIREEVGFGQDPRNEALFVGTPLPAISHFMNMVFYLLLILITYFVLKKIFPGYDNVKWYLSLPFIATLLFALHPLHTEAVANIKGRDEILCMLGGMMTLWCILKYTEKRNVLFLILSFFTMLSGIFAKENAITFIAVIPLTLYYAVSRLKKSDWIWTLVPALSATVIFLIFRHLALGSFMAEDTSGTVLNNPYLYSTTPQRIATVIFTWGIYLKLMFFPHPLTHDYYPNQITITDFGNPVVWILIIFFLFLIADAFMKLKSKNVISYGILFFVITFSIVSNLFFTVGTFLNERFVFISLLGFTIILAYFLIRFARLPIPRMIIPAVLILIFSFYSVKTISRNRVWQDDFTLFTTDVNVSSNSIKCNVSAGGNYLKRYKESKKETDFTKALECLYKAISLDETNFFAHHLLGEAYFEKEDYDLSYQFYKNAVEISPQNTTAIGNMEVAMQAKANSQISLAEKEMENGNSAKALEIINAYLSFYPEDVRALDVKGRILGMGLQNIDSALVYLRKALDIDPEYISALENTGVAYAVKGEHGKAIAYLLKAHELSPEKNSIIQNIILVYTNMGNSQKASEWKNKSDP